MLVKKENINHSPKDGKFTSGKGKTVGTGSSEDKGKTSLGRKRRPDGEKNKSGKGKTVETDSSKDKEKTGAVRMKRKKKEVPNVHAQRQSDAKFLFTGER